MQKVQNLSWNHIKREKQIFNRNWLKETMQVDWLVSFSPLIFKQLKYNIQFEPINQKLALTFGVVLCWFE